MHLADSILVEFCLDGTAVTEQRQTFTVRMLSILRYSLEYRASKMPAKLMFFHEQYQLQITEDGTYLPPPKDNQKATYSTMVFVRADIVANAARYLAKAACIATRYCCVRRQTAEASGKPELQVCTASPVPASASQGHVGVLAREGSCLFVWLTRS
jgi:hypothetical protein